MLGRGRASMAALTATLEGVLVPTDHRSPARGCAICWKSGCTAPSQQIQGQFLHPLPPRCSSPLAMRPLPEPPLSGDAGQRCWLPPQPARASRLAAAAQPRQRQERRSEARPLAQPSVLSLPLAFYFQPLALPGLRFQALPQCSPAPPSCQAGQGHLVQISGK